MTEPPPAAPPPPLSATHRRRLAQLWRSAGWPSHDAIELDLLAAALLERHWSAQGHETLRVTQAGLHWLAQGRRRAQAALGAHEALVSLVAQAQQRAGRIVWRRLSLRAPLPQADGRTHWAMAMPDVFSIRHTTLAERVEPVVHEIKVSRADWLSDLRRPDKGRAYAALGSACWYVLREGLAQPEEVPPEYGLLFALAPAFDRLELVRPAPTRPATPSLALWMALARANAEPPLDDDAQEGLREAEG